MKEAIQFSGGKDSLALLYLMRPRLKDVPVYFADSGMVYPHVATFIERTCDKLGATLRIVKPPEPIEEFQKREGLPADIVPVEASIMMRPYVKAKPGPLIQASISCCARMVWEPMQQAMAADGIKIIYRGSKARDRHVGVADGFVADGVTYRSPLWDWTDDMVFAYLRSVSAELPAHYTEVNNSFDCLYCTAFLNHQNAESRLAWTRAHYPEAWPKLAGRLGVVRKMLVQEIAEISKSLSLEKLE